MRLLLISQNILTPEIKKCLQENILDIDNKKVCLIYTIKDPGDDQWLSGHCDDFDKLGLEYDAVNISEDKDYSNLLNKYGIFYVAGGNTFYILDRLKKTGLFDVLLKAIDNNLLYIGQSAGSIIASKDISIANIGPDGDDNDISLEDLSGLSKILFHIYPHFMQEDGKYVEEFFAIRKEPVVTLTDNQAVFVSEKGCRLLGLDQNLELGIKLDN